MMCEAFVWPDGFARGWTEAVRLYDLLCTIAVLTAADTQHVERLDMPSWARFLQILEDAGPAWMVAVLHGPAAQNITTRAALKTLLTANDLGGTVPVSGVLDVFAREAVKCWGSVVCLATLLRIAPRSPVRTRSGVRVLTRLACRGRRKSTTH
jgi:hypothetical protein